MAINKIINYTLNKLFFPKVVVIDRPGIIISKTSSKYSSKESKKRIIWCFEDITVNLQLRTVKALGKEKSGELWYRIGKDIGTKYLLMSGAKKIPSFLFNFIIKYIFTGFYGSGQSFAKKVNFNRGKRELIIEGRNNIVCRKTADGSFTAGLISGIISFLRGKNIEAETYCDCPNHCKIIANPNNKRRYIPDRKKLFLDPLYFKINFPKRIIHHAKLSSFSDMIKFKKIKFDKEGKFTFRDKALLLGEIGMLDIIANHFIDIGLKELLDKSVIEAAEKLATELLPKKEKPLIKLQRILNLFCAFGNGIPRYNLTKNTLYIRFKFAPYTNYSFYYQALVLNGFINIIFDRNFKLKNREFNKLNSSITLKYT